MKILKHPIIFNTIPEKGLVSVEKIGQKNYSIKTCHYTFNQNLMQRQLQDDLFIPKDLNLNQFISLIKNMDINSPKQSETIFTKKISSNAYSPKFLRKNNLEKSLNKDENNNCLIDFVSTEHKFVKESEGINLKKSLQASEYFQCSIKDTKSVLKVFNSAINVATNFRIKKDEATPRQINKIDDRNKLNFSESINSKQENENEQHNLIAYSLQECDKEKKKNVFSSLFKFKCFSCTRSETLASISSQI